MATHTKICGKAPEKLDMLKEILKHEKLISECIKSNMSDLDGGVLHMQFISLMAAWKSEKLDQIKKATISYPPSSAMLTDEILV